MGFSIVRTKITGNTFMPRSVCKVSTASTPGSDSCEDPWVTSHRSQNRNQKVCRLIKGGKTIHLKATAALVPPFNNTSK